MKKLSFFNVRRDSIFHQIEDSETKYDAQLEEFAKGNVMNIKILKNCRAMSSGETCSVLTKIALYLGALIQATCVICIALANLLGIWATNTQTIIIVICIAVGFGLPLCLVSTLTTGCFTDCSSDCANVGQNSYGKLKSYFSHLGWRIMRRYYEFEQDEAVALCVKIYGNIAKLQDEIAAYIGMVNTEDILVDLLNAVHYISTDNDSERKTVFREWVNEEIKSYITSQVQIHNLQCGLRDLMLDVLHMKEKMQLPMNEGVYQPTLTPTTRASPRGSTKFKPQILVSDLSQEVPINKDTPSNTNEDQKLE
jgi:hypothetical protein